jgi:hypothetical protein
LWAAIDVDTNEILALHVSRGRGIPSAIEFLRKVLDSCEGNPVIVVDRGPWYGWALERLGMTYFHETFGNRNGREVVFHNNVNSKNLKSMEEIATAVAIVHNLVRTGMRGGNTNLTVPFVGTVKLILPPFMEVIHSQVSPIASLYHRAKTCCEEEDGIKLPERRVPVEPKWIGKRDQHHNNLHHGQRSQKGLSKTCQNY